MPNDQKVKNKSDGVCFDRRSNSSLVRIFDNVTFHFLIKIFHVLHDSGSCFVFHANRLTMEGLPFEKGQRAEEQAYDRRQHCGDNIHASNDLEQTWYTADWMPNKSAVILSMCACVYVWVRVWTSVVANQKCFEGQTISSGFATFSDLAIHTFTRRKDGAETASARSNRFSSPSCRGYRIGVDDGSTKTKWQPSNGRRTNRRTASEIVTPNPDDQGRNKQMMMMMVEAWRDCDSFSKMYTCSAFDSKKIGTFLMSTIRTFGHHVRHGKCKKEEEMLQSGNAQRALWSAAHVIDQLTD